MFRGQILGELLGEALGGCRRVAQDEVTALGGEGFGDGVADAWDNSAGESQSYEGQVMRLTSRRAGDDTELLFQGAGHSEEIRCDRG